MWFSDAGSEVVSKKITVTPPPGEVVVPAIARFIEPEYAKGPTFQMNGIAKKEVLLIASRNRMKVVHIQEGKNVWVDYGYIFKKSDGSRSVVDGVLQRLLSAFRS